VYFDIIRSHSREGSSATAYFPFYSIMVVQGYQTTGLMKLKPGYFASIDSCNGVKKMMSHESILNNYVKVVATNFELPDFLFHQLSNCVVEDEDPGHSWNLLTFQGINY
jgi:hypothetical protein